MASILYVETNYPIGYAKGQDPSSDWLAGPGPRPFRLAIPAVCFMEALTVLKAEAKATNKLVVDLLHPAREARRDETSTIARSLLGHLEQAQSDARTWIVDFRVRLTHCLEQLAVHAELISLDAGAALDCLVNPILAEPTDGLILHAILAHARASDPGPKAFLSANKNDFGQIAAVKALEAAGVRYFSSSQAAIGWLTSQTGS